MSYVFRILLAILVVYLLIKVMSSFFTFVAAAFMPLLILAAVVFLARGFIRGKERRA